jgi:hypothetical protein
MCAEMRNRMEEILENEICVRYERNNGVNYAVIDTKEEWKCEDDYEVKMLMLNTPEYFLHITMNYIDEKNSIYYDISSKQQLSKLFEYGKVTMEDVKSLFDNISRMVRVVDEYMLNLDRVILNPQDTNFTYQALFFNTFIIIFVFLISSSALFLRTS